MEGKSKKWISVQIDQEWINKPRKMKALSYAIHHNNNTNIPINLKRNRTIPYAIGIEHYRDEDTLKVCLTDVTPRYANSWSLLKQLRGNQCHDWFCNAISKWNNNNNKTSTNQSLNKTNKHDDHQSSNNIIIDISNEEQTKQQKENGNDNITSFHNNNNNNNDGVIKKKNQDNDEEEAEFELLKLNESMPTTKLGFKNHVLYVLESQLNTTEIMTPDANSHVCGMFKGELIYRLASAVSEIRTATKWLHLRRRVKDNQKLAVKRKKKKNKHNRTTMVLIPFNHYKVIWL